MTYWLHALLVGAALTASSCSPNEQPIVAHESTTSAAEAPPAQRPAPKRPRIVFLGDSLTAGYGLDLEQSVPSLVQKQLDADGYTFEVVNAGVSGDTSAGGLRRLNGRSMATFAYSFSSSAPMTVFGDCPSPR
jgi:acyl-CoA thioesterase-1